MIWFLSIIWHFEGILLDRIYKPCAFKVVLRMFISCYWFGQQWRRIIQCWIDSINDDHLNGLESEANTKAEWQICNGDSVSHHTTTFVYNNNYIAYSVSKKNLAEFVRHEWRNKILEKVSYQWSLIRPW